MAASALFDEPLRIVRGKSFRKSDKDLFKRIQRLFEKRNAVVHRGATISNEEADDLVGTAFETFRALEALEEAE